MRANAHPFAHVLALVVHAEQENAHRRQQRADAGRRVQAGLLRHRDIQHDDIRHVLLRQLHRDASVGRLRHHFDARIGIEDVA